MRLIPAPVKRFFIDWLSSPVCVCNRPDCGGGCWNRVEPEPEPVEELQSVEIDEPGQLVFTELCQSPFCHGDPINPADVDAVRDALATVDRSQFRLYGNSATVTALNLKEAGACDEMGLDYLCGAVRVVLFEGGKE